MKSASVRDHCNALFSMVNAIALQLLKDILRVGVAGFAPRCNNVVLFSPVGRVRASPGLRAGSGLKP